MMNKPEFFVTPGYGERQLRTFHYSQEEVNQAMTERFCHYMPDHVLVWTAWQSPPSVTQRCRARFALRPFFRNEGNEPELIIRPNTGSRCRKVTALIRILCWLYSSAACRQLFKNVK
jgi:hypothetical protein